MQRRSASTEYQREIVGRHVGDLDQRQTGAARELFHRLDIAHTPFRISVAQAGIESCIAFGAMPAVAREGTIEKKHPAFA
jgi:hypothetical protein